MITQDKAILVIILILAILALFVSIKLFMLSASIKKNIDEIRRLKQKQESEDYVTAKLGSMLRYLCQNLKIPLTEHDDLGEQAGHIQYHWIDGMVYSPTIALLKCNLSNFVLAHELGHYFALYNGDNSEESADREGYMLCKELLTSEDFNTIQWMLDCYFLGKDANDEKQ